MTMIMMLLLKDVGATDITSLQGKVKGTFSLILDGYKVLYPMEGISNPKP